MAIAIHLKETKKMDYQYKSYPETNWKLYTSWVHLKKIPKFAYTTTTSESTSSAVSTRSKTKGDDNESTTSTSPIKDNSSCLSNPSRGVGRGQNTAMVQQLKLEKEKTKRKREVEKDKKLSVSIDSMTELKESMAKKSKASIVKYAINSYENEDDKKVLQAKLVKMALEL